MMNGMNGNMMNAGLDNKYLISPDFICPDLFSASRFITSHYKIIYDYISETLGKVDKGSVIKIGGLSRAGKSTFASVLKYYLNDLGFKTHLISLDRWIRSENDRKETVLGRYDIESIKNMFNKIENSSKNEIKLNPNVAEVFKQFPEATITSIKNS